MPRDIVKIVEITELPSAEAEVRRGVSGLARPNRSLAEMLTIEHRVSHELLVRAGVTPGPPLTAEEKLLRALFGEKALDASDPDEVAEVGAKVRRYQNVIRHLQGRVVFSDADEGEVEGVERDKEGLPEGIGRAGCSARGCSARSGTTSAAADAHRLLGVGRPLDRRSARRPLLRAAADPGRDRAPATRTLKRLEDAGIMTLLDLVQRTDSELLRIKGFSRAALKEVKDLLAAMGLSLGMRV
jgi:hypothetical protein